MLVACVVGLSVLAAATLAVGSFFEGDQKHEKVDCSRFTFDREAWLAPRATGPGGESITTREQLADALTRCDLLEGLSEREVRKMLGRPYRPGREGTYMQYYLGQSRGVIHFDFEYLTLRFKHQRVAQSWISTI